MISRRMSNMALMLLLVFVIPVVYQSSHVLMHHSHDNFHSCSVEQNGINYFLDDSEQYQHCAIAEYTFTHQDLPKDQLCTSANNFNVEIINFYTHSGYINLKVDKKSSRAPPSM